MGWAADGRGRADIAAAERRGPILRKLIAMDIGLMDDRRVMADAVVVLLVAAVGAAAATDADDKNVGREEGLGEWAN